MAKTKVNPLRGENLKQGDRWQQINSIRAGASLKTCGKNPEESDPRLYGVALLDSYPALHDLCLGEWTEDAERDCLQLLQDAANRGSMPMALVGLLSLQSYPEPVRDGIWKELELAEQSSLQFLLDLAESNRDYRNLFVTAS